MASDEEPAEQSDAATPVPATAAIATPAIAVNGRRKSASRKSTKKHLVSELKEVLTSHRLPPQSGDTILPEDENDDPMELEPPAVASPLPVRPCEYCFSRFSLFALAPLPKAQSATFTQVERPSFLT